jgi:hypothetical protein
MKTNNIIIIEMEYYESNGYKYITTLRISNTTRWIMGMKSMMVAMVLMKMMPKLNLQDPNNGVMFRLCW